MNVTLTEAQQQLSLDLDGFVQYSAIDDDTVMRLTELYANLKSNSPTDSFFTTTMSSDIEYRKAANAGIVKILSAFLEKSFQNFKVVYANFMVKPCGERSVCELHQDWTYVDEERYNTLNLWIPLTNLSEKNGAIKFVKASHQIDKRIRGRNIWWPYHGISDYIINHELNPVLLKQGESVVFNSKTFHYSPPNYSHLERVAVSVVVAPMEAPLMHYYAQNDEIWVCNVNSDFFVEYGVFDKGFTNGLNSRFFATDSDYRRVLNHAFFNERVSIRT